MGKVMSMVSRKVNRFNVENRAHRLLDKDQIRPAPKYESSIEDMKRTLDNDPEFIERTSKKDSQLDNRLKKVFVTSETQIIAPKEKSNEDRSLPLSRSAAEEYEFGYKLPDRVRPGRVTLKQALKFMENHQTIPEEHTSDKIAEEYKLKPEVVENILKHFKILQVHIPDKNAKERILQQPKAPALEDKT